MSTSINPEDYNIDKLNTGMLGPIETTDFRSHALSYNLQNTNTDGLNEYAGDLIGNNDNIIDLPTATQESVIPREINVGSNEYGPSNFISYSSNRGSTEVESDTGYSGYKTRVGGDFRSTLLGKQLGFSLSSGIDYESELSEIGKEERKFNVKERVKLNLASETVGKINLDPVGLLSGQDIFLKDYTITKAPGLGGKALDFAEKLSGFKIPTSILPSWKSVNSNEGYDVNQDLLNFTSEGTKGLLYEAINQNKWGPRFQGGGKPEEPKTKVGKFIKKANDVIDDVFGGGDLPLTIKYTDPVRPNIISEREESLVDRLNDKISGIIDSAKRKITPTVVPVEGEQPTSEDDPTLFSSGLGFEIDKRPFNYVDEKNQIDDFNKSNKSKIYGSKFKVTTTFSNDKVENVGDKDTFFWSSQNKEKAKRGLLRYTQNLINESIDNDSSSAKFIGIVNDDKNFNGNDNTKHQVFSQGNRVRSGASESDVYCRSWSIRNPYSRYTDAVRAKKLTGRDKIFQELSVLEDNGMPKIVPYVDEYKKSTNEGGNPQKYMLSLENLAWKGAKEYSELADIEKGPNGGRLMWFPPYNIDFNDNSTVNWDSTSFIGRGEPVYTYNNTERGGNLSFTIIVDHPSSLNEFRGQTEDILERYFAGCGDEPSGFREFDEDVVEPEVYEVPEPIESPTITPPKLSFYFQNSSNGSQTGRDVQTDLNSNYETNQPTLNTATEQTIPAGLNYNFNDDLDNMVNFLLTQQGKRYRIISEGFTSSLSTTSYNKKLSKDRAQSLKDYLTNALLKKESETNVSVEWPQKVLGESKTFPRESEWKNNNIRWSQPEGRGESVDSGANKALTGKETPEQLQQIVNDPKAKKGRVATITLELSKEIDDFMTSKVNSEVEQINKDRRAEYNRKNNKAKETAKKLTKRLVNEATYFNKIQKEDSFIFDTFKSKIKNFHPAFHSMTPEGLNSRITFLKQCTRQGPSYYNENDPSNLVFGKPPIVILRVGDFYHTKIVISSMNFTYEPLIWDLNPEGIGVQPMVVKVDMNFSFIGGSSLGGPINELQNAVSFNFFGNTSVYNRRRDVLIKDNKDTKIGTNSSVFSYGSYVTPNQKSVPLTDKDVSDNNESSNTEKNIDLTSSVLTETPNGDIPVTELDEVVIIPKPKTRVLKISSLKVGSPCGVEPNVRVVEVKLKLENYSNLTESEKEDFILKGMSVNIIGDNLSYSEEIKTTNIDSVFNIGDGFLGNCGTKGVPKIKQGVEYDIQLIYENNIVSSNFFKIGNSDEYISLF